MRKLIHILLFFTVSLSAQTHWPVDSFEIIFSHNFNSDTEGPYDYDEWDAVWHQIPGYSLSNDLDWCFIETVNGNNCMRWDYPEWSSNLFATYAYGDHTEEEVEINPYLPGGIDENHPIYGGRKGTQGEKWYSYFNANHDEFDEIYMSYDLMFRPGFEFCWSGKVNGMGAFPYFSDGSPDEGFRSSIQWKGTGDDNQKPWYEGGCFGQYIYHHADPNRPPPYDAYPISWVTPDPYNTSEQYYKINPVSDTAWINVTQRLVTNTPVTHNNGRAEIFIDQRLYYSMGQLRLREQASQSIDNLKIYTQFGGLDRQFRALRDEWVRLDNIIVWRYADNVVNVVRGSTSSGAGAELHLPVEWSNTTADYTDEDPIVSDIPIQTIDEGDSFNTINLDDYVTDVQDPVEDISWSYSGNDSITVDITDRVATLTYTTGPTYSWTGSEAITFTAEDTDTNTDSDITTFTVVDTSSQHIITLVDTLQAESFCDLSNNAIGDVDTFYFGQEIVISTPDTAWFKICNVDFGIGGWELIGFNTSTALSNTGMALKLDSETADSIAYTILENTDLYVDYVTNYTELFEDITGVHDIYIQGYNSQSACDYIVFSKTALPSGNIVIHNGKLVRHFNRLLK